jgi:hypothetical protein
VEFEVSERARRTAHRFPRHTHYKAEQAPGPGVVSEYLVTLRISPGRASSTSPQSCAPQSRASCRNQAPSSFVQPALG